MTFRRNNIQPVIPEDSPITDFEDKRYRGSIPARNMRGQGSGFPLELVLECFCRVIREMTPRGGFTINSVLEWSYRVAFGSGKVRDSFNTAMNPDAALELSLGNLYGKLKQSLFPHSVGDCFGIKLLAKTIKN